MKTKSLILALAGALFLTACNNTSPDSNPVTSGDPASSSEVPASASASLTDEEISAKALEDLIAKLGNKKQKINVAIGNEDYGDSIYAEKGFVQKYQDELSGCVQNNQGWFSFTITNNVLSLGGAVSLNKAATPYVYGPDIAALGKDIYTADPTNPKRFTSTNADLLSLGGDFVGADTSASALTVLVDDAEIVYGFTIGSAKVYLTFSEFGTASNAVLDAFIAAPRDKAAPVAFTAQEYASLSAIMGTDASKVPFPSWASFAYNSGYSEKQGLFYVVDFNPAADAVATYGDQLVAKGWTKNAEASKENDEYYTLAIADNAQQLYVANVSFTSAAEIDNPAYPNGVVEIDFYKAGGSSSSGSHTPESVAADINANLAAAGYSTIQLEYYSQVDSWVVGEINFGAIGSVTQAQACATLATFLPSYVTQYAAYSGPQDPASGANDYVGDGSAYYLYFGATQDMVIVEIYAYDYGGNVYGDIWVYEYAAS